jgi:hypothetical protein
MISTVKATMHKMVGALADDLLPPRDLAQAAFAVMVWASSKMSAEERDKLLTGFGIAIRDRVSALPDATIPPKGPSPSSPKSKQSAVRSKRSAATPSRPSRQQRTERG